MAKPKASFLTPLECDTCHRHLGWVYEWDLQGSYFYCNFCMQVMCDAEDIPYKGDGLMTCGDVDQDTSEYMPNGLPIPVIHDGQMTPEIRVHEPCFEVMCPDCGQIGCLGCMNPLGHVHVCGDEDWDDSNSG